MCLQCDKPVRIVARWILIQTSPIPHMHESNISRGIEQDKPLGTATAKQGWLRLKNTVVLVIFTVINPTLEHWCVPSNPPHPTPSRNIIRPRKNQSCCRTPLCNKGARWTNHYKKTKHSNSPKLACSQVISFPGSRVCRRVMQIEKAESKSLTSRKQWKKKKKLPRHNPHCRHLVRWLLSRYPCDARRQRKQQLFTSSISGTSLQWLRRRTWFILAPSFSARFMITLSTRRFIYVLAREIIIKKNILK